MFSVATGLDAKSSFDKDVALYNLIFLLASVPFYWIIVASFEMKVFDNICLCRCIKKAGRSRNELFGTYGSFVDV